MGVATEARRAGVGEQLMRALLDVARAAGVTARAARGAGAERAGARALREARVPHVATARGVAWDQPVATGSAAPVEASEPRVARRRVACTRGARPSRGSARTATLDRLDVSTPALRRAARRSAAMRCYRVTDGRASVLQLAADGRGGGGRAADAIRSRAAGVNLLRYLNVPDDDPAAAAACSWRVRASAAQFEMALEL